MSPARNSVVSHGPDEYGDGIARPSGSPGRAPRSGRSVRTGGRRLAMATAIGVALVATRSVAPTPAGAQPLAGTAQQRVVAAPSSLPTAAITAGGLAAELPANALGTHVWPVPGAVVRPWDAPPSPYAPGHRGVDLAAAPGDPVRAMAAGTVGFAGVVAGHAWVSIDHPQGLRTTVGPLATIAVESGDVVAQATLVGTAAATAHADASTLRTGRLHVSARVDGTYVDPTPLVGRLVATLLPAPPAENPSLR